MIRGTVYEKRRAEKNPCPSCGLSFYERTLVSVIADFDSCGHGGVGLIVRYRRRFDSPESIQSFSLDDGRKILVAGIKVNISGDTVYLAFFRILPHRIGTAVVGPIHPVRKPDRVVGFNIIGCVGKQGNVIKLRKSSKEIRSKIKGIEHTPDRIYQKKA